MGQLPELRADTICHLKISLETSGIFSQHQRLRRGPQHDLVRIRLHLRAYGTNTRHSTTGIIIIRLIYMDQSRIPTYLFLYYLLRHSSERCCISHFPASASAGPHLYFLLQSNIWEVQGIAFKQDR